MTDIVKPITMPIVGTNLPRMAPAGSRGPAAPVAKKPPPVFSAELASAAHPIIPPFDPILLWGDTGAGKPPLCGEYIRETGRGEKKRPRYYTGDRGGVES